MTALRRPAAFDRGRRVVLRSVAAFAVGALAASAPARSKERVIRVVAKKFAFVPDEIRVAKGETVVLQFTTPEVPMGFHLADFDARVDIVPGQVATLRLTPDRTGRFTFVCDVFCGSGHEDMSGTLVVT